MSFNSIKIILPLQISCTLYSDGLKVLKHKGQYVLYVCIPILQGLIKDILIPIEVIQIPTGTSLKGFMHLWFLSSFFLNYLGRRCRRKQIKMKEEMRKSSQLKHCASCNKCVVIFLVEIFTNLLPRMWAGSCFCLFLGCRIDCFATLIANKL